MGAKGSIMGIGKHIRRAFGTFLAVCLVAGMLPMSAFGAGTFVDSLGVDSSNATQMADEVKVSGGAASSSVFVEVASDDFELVGRSPDYVAADVSGALAFYGSGDGSRIWVQTQGGTSPISGTWEVSRDGVSVGSFACVQQPDGTWPLALSADGAADTLKVEAEHEYSCAFTAKDAEGRSVSALVTFLVQASSPYGAKTVYEYDKYEQTFDGVAHYDVPSVTGIIHKDTQYVAATEAQPLSPTYSSLMEMAADYAKEKKQSGAYALVSAWSLAPRFEFPQPDPQPLAYKGALGVVLSIVGAEDETPAVGSMVTVFGFDGSGKKTPFECRVKADELGNKYVAFDDATLGAYAIGVYRPSAPTGPSEPGTGEDPQALIVEASVQGSGFINYEGTYTWPKSGAVRYVFTPVVPGNVLDKLVVLADGRSLDVPAWATIAGYYDLQLDGDELADVSRVEIIATFKSTGSSTTDPTDPDKPTDPTDPTDPDSPDNPANKKHTLTVQTEGAGDVEVTVNRYASVAPHKYNDGDAIRLTCVPTGANQSVRSATLYVDGMPYEIPLNVQDGACAFTAPAANSMVKVIFSAEDAPITLSHSVKVVIQGGHASIDAPFTTQASAMTESTKASIAALPATFTLFPESGWRLYTALEGGVEVGAYFTQVSGAYELNVPYIGRDRTIVVTFVKAEELPPVVQPGTFVNIDVQTVAVDGLPTSSLPTPTPNQVAVPKGATYSFYLIPAPSGDAELAYVRMKRDADLLWVDVTSQAKWISWPEGGDAGYWLLTLESVQADTHVRAGFRSLQDGEQPRPACKTRNITINVVGNEYGAVFPNTVGKDPLKVPAGKTITVTVVTKSGYKYEVKKAEDARQANVMASGDIALTAPLADVADEGEGESTSTEVVGSPGDADEDWTFVFGPNGAVGPTDPDDPNNPGDKDPDNPDDPNKPGDKDPNDPNNPNDPNGPGNSNGSNGGDGNQGGDANIGASSARFTVTPVVVPDSAGRTHGFISPANPITAARGGSVAFAFMREVGYRVQYVEVNGSRVSGFTQNGYQLKNIQQDTIVRVAFAPEAQTDSMGSLQRTIHRITSLAKTGDLNAPGITLLLGVACAAAGFAILSATKSRRRLSALAAAADDGPEEEADE